MERDGTHGMAEIREGLKYSDSHFWVEVEDETTVRVGLTEHGQQLLGEVAVVTLPSEGDTVDADTGMGEIEGEEGTLEVVSPVSGSIVQFNGDLEESPSLINEDPYGDGWLYIVQITDPEELDTLMSSSEYEEFLQAEEGDDEE